MDILLWIIAAWFIYRALGILATAMRQLADEMERFGSEDTQQ